MSNPNQESFNQAALKALERRIDLYNQNQIELPSLAQELYIIVSNMLEVPTNWNHKFMQYWGDIEEVNALALDKGSCKPLVRDRKILAKALSGIKELIDEGL